MSIKCCRDFALVFSRPMNMNVFKDILSCNFEQFYSKIQNFIFLNQFDTFRIPASSGGSYKFGFGCLSVTPFSQDKLITFYDILHVVQ